MLHRLTTMLIVGAVIALSTATASGQAAGQSTVTPADPSTELPLIVITPPPMISERPAYYPERQPEWVRVRRGNIGATIAPLVIGGIGGGLIGTAVYLSGPYAGSGCGFFSCLAGTVMGFFAGAAAGALFMIPVWYGTQHDEIRHPRGWRRVRRMMQPTAWPTERWSGMMVGVSAVF